MIHALTITAAAIAGWVARSRWQSLHDRRVRDHEYQLGHAVGWLEGVEHGERRAKDHLTGLPRALDAAFEAGRAAAAPLPREHDPHLSN